jgi:chromosome segregation ATPase
MTEEEIKALQDAKEAAEKAAAEASQAAEAARADAEKAKTDLEGVVDELKTERQKKNEALEQAQKITNNDPAASQPQDVASLVNQALEQKEKERVQKEIESAIEEFKGSKTEFQGDSAGLVFEKFKKEMNKFNFADVRGKEEAKRRLEEIYRFANLGSANEDGEQVYNGTPRSGQNIPDTEGRLRPEVEKTLSVNGVDPEKFKKLSAKYGDAVANLGLR